MAISNLNFNLFYYENTLIPPLSAHFNPSYITCCTLCICSLYLLDIQTKKKKQVKESFKSRLTFEFYVFINSVVKIFSCITKDIIDSILSMNKKYHWLIGTFLYMLINSIIPLYCLFIGDINKIFKEGSYRTTDFVTYYTSFKFSVYIFLITFIIFIIRQYININRQLRNNKNKDHSM